MDAKHAVSIILGLGFMASSATHAQEIDATWARVAAGVFEKTEGDVTTRIAFGAEGAAHDRALLTTEIRRLENLSANGFASSEQVSDLAQLKEALAGIPIAPKSGAVPFATNNGVLCGRFYYGLDSHMVVGTAGAAVVARSGAQEDGFGPPVPFNYIRRYARAIVTPTFGPPAITVTNNTTAMNVTSFANWQRDVTTPAVIPSGHCTGSSYAYVQIDAPSACSPNPGFVSQTKTYATCVGSL